MYRVQYPTVTGLFRPDLNFDGASERETEVGDTLRQSLIMHIDYMGCVYVCL